MRVIYRPHVIGHMHVVARLKASGTGPVHTLENGDETMEAGNDVVEAILATIYQAREDGREVQQIKLSNDEWMRFRNGVRIVEPSPEIWEKAEAKGLNDKYNLWFYGVKITRASE